MKKQNKLENKMEYETQLKILERLYEQGRRTLPKLKRELRNEDLKLSYGYTLEEERVDGRLQVKREVRYWDGRYGYEIEKRALAEHELILAGFSSENPPLQEFLKKNGLEKEIDTFMELYTRTILEREGERNKSYTEQRMRDVETQIRAHNRNRNYKEEWEGDD